MASVHYKFRSLTTYKTLNFNALHISLEEFKESVMEAEGLHPERFDLVVENSVNKRIYVERDLIPRNTSLILKRVPREDGAKLPKVQDVSSSGIVTAPTAKRSISNVENIDFTKMTEEERLEHVRRVSYEKYHPTKYHKKPRYADSADPPPTSYTCNRCNKPGHWVKNCPLGNLKKTTGIPMEDLIPTTADDPRAMLHPSGRLMAHKMHVTARLNSKAKVPIPFLRDLDLFGMKNENNATETISSLKQEEESETFTPPSELTCPICSKFFTEAVTMSCCGWSFCAECIQSMILEKPGGECPGQNCDESLSVDAMIPNLCLRRFVQTFQRKIA